VVDIEELLKLDKDNEAAREEQTELEELIRREDAGKKVSWTLLLSVKLRGVDV
jgi:hypothetical protein